MVPKLNFVLYIITIAIAEKKKEGDREATKRKEKWRRNKKDKLRKEKEKWRRNPKDRLRKEKETPQVALRIFSSLQQAVLRLFFFLQPVFFVPQQAALLGCIFCP